MENFIGTINVSGNINIQSNGSAEETFNGLLDNTASFKELLACLRKQAGENNELIKEKRCPGSEQLRNGHRLIAQITVGEATVEVYENGYGIFDNGDRKTVVWVPDCPKAARYYYPATYDEKCKEERRLRGEDYEDDPDCRIVEGTEFEEDRLDEEQLAEMAWYLAVVIAGENRIEQNLVHPISAGSRSDRYNDDLDSTGRYSWSCGARFQNPEDAVIYKEEQAERCADLTEKQWEVYRYYYEEEYTQEEIADMLGISHQAVCERLECVRKKISEYYEKNR